MIYYELLKDGTIGRSTNNIKVAKLNEYYNENQVVDSENDIVYGYNGKRYLRGNEPVKPQEIIDKEKAFKYEEMIVTKIRERYTIDQELAILRQRDVKPEEFVQYNAYAEQCKQEAKNSLTTN